MVKPARDGLSWRTELLVLIGIPLLMLAGALAYRHLAHPSQIHQAAVQDGKSPTSTQPDQN